MIPKLDEYKKRWHFESTNDIKPGLEAVEKALYLLKNPEKELNIIHVSGTNGKGSTIQYMQSLLMNHGYSVGTFTSPAIYDVHDQIKINDKPITAKEMNKAFQQVATANLSGRLTDFELLTVLAFLIFHQKKPAYILVETGMGGKLDSTNVVHPILSIITSIAIDHTQFLGNSIEEISAHKGGIIKNNMPVVTGRLDKVAQGVIDEIAKKRKAPLRSYGKHFKIVEKDNECFVGKKAIHLSGRKMKGEHQQMNSAIAIEALLQIGIQLEEEIVQNVLQTTELQNRFEEVLPNIFFDGAHNPAAAKALRKTIEQQFPNEKISFYIGMLKTKDIKKTLDELIPVAKDFTFIDFQHPDAANAEELFGICQFGQKRIANFSALKELLFHQANEKIIVAGSLYLIVMLKSYLR